MIKCATLHQTKFNHVGVIRGRTRYFRLNTICVRSVLFKSKLTFKSLCTSQRLKREKWQLNFHG